MSFEFLKTEIEHEGQLIKRDDVWQEKNGSKRKVISICEDDKRPFCWIRMIDEFGEDNSHERSSRDVIRDMTLIERDGMPWPREEESCRHTKDISRCLVCRPHIVLAGVPDNEGFVKYPKETPALVEGRRHWNTPNQEWQRLETVYSEFVAFIFNEESGSTYSIEKSDIIKEYDLSRDWWTECAVGMWYDSGELNGIWQIGDMQLPMRDSEIGRKIESGEIKLYPSRKLAEENNNG